MKRTILFTAAMSTALGLFALGANAESQGDDQSQNRASGADVMTITEIATLLEGQGYTVREIELERNRYEVEMIDGKGMLVEAYLDAATGEVLPYGSDDDDRYRDDD